MSKIFYAIILLLLTGLLGGTIVWWVWPSAVLAFPTLVAKGYLVAEITWVSAVCLSFLCGVLIKTRSSNSED